VLEIEPRPFSRLSLATWRRVDPCEYDWPHPHHGAGRFPLLPAAAHRVPLRQRRASGARLAQLFMHTWQQRLTLQAAVGWCGGQVQLHTSADAKLFLPLQPAGVTPTTAATAIDVPGPWHTLQPGAVAGKSRRFGAVLSCIGFGAERCAEDVAPGAAALWGGYGGPRFWEDYDGVPDQGQPCALNQAVVSGGGDGAMQDLQRLATGQFGLALLRRLNSALAMAMATTKAEAEPLATLEMQHMFMAAEDSARRAYAWQGARAPQQALETWHKVFEDAVEARMNHLAALPGGQVLPELARGVLRPELFQPGGLHITWLWRDKTPGYAFALNRFLCLVLLQLAQRTGLHQRLQAWPQHAVHSVVPGAPHALVVKQLASGTTQPLQADLLLVRHGILPNPLLGGPAVPEQLVPYDLPA